MYYRPHPIADIFPLITGEEFVALKQDIRENGLREAIWLYEGMILDGRNRFRACQEVGVEPAFRAYEGDSPATFAVSLNLHRRHLDKSQAATVGVELLPHLEREAKARQRAAGGDRGNQYTGGKVAVGQKIDQAAPESTAPETPRRADRALDIAAKLTGTNRQYVADAKKLKEQNPEVFEQVKAGEKTIVQARRELKEERRERQRQENREKIVAAGSTAVLETLQVQFPTILIDPPWDWGDEGDQDQLGRARPDYSTMSFEQLLELNVADLSMPDAHLYLWITNRSLPKGFALLERWGFRYVTCLTWVKSTPDIAYKCQSCHALFSSTELENEHGLQRHREASGSGAESVSQDQARRRESKGEPSERMPLLQKGICCDAQEHEILRERLRSSAQVNDDGGEATSSWKTEPEKQGVDDIKRLQIPVSARASDGEQAGVCSGTPNGNVGNDREATSSGGTRPPQKQGSNGQQAREPGVGQCSGAHGYPLGAAVGDMPLLRTCPCCGGRLKEYRALSNFGMGNYFRGATEQVLFGVRGSLMLKRRDVGTAFHAPRGPNGHSSKPLEFYDLVESCSPGPYLEMFSRSARQDWTTWGQQGLAANAA